MNILEIKDLHTYFNTKSGIIKAVNGVSLDIKKGHTLGVIGESGSGKSQTAMSILKLFEKNQRIHSGEVIFDGENISNLDANALRNYRGNSISMIFQEPMTSLNPVFTIEKQISEALILHKKMDKKQAKLAVIDLLNSVKIANPKIIAKSYPHNLSGGMRQRVMIAIALACKPKLLIADEPTTALDVTIASQILNLMNELRKDYGTSIMFITHNLGIVRQIADEVAVMYCGEVVEHANVSQIFDKNNNFIHPYTHALMNSIPTIHKTKTRLQAINGSVPHPLDLPVGCKFSTRCAFAEEKCNFTQPELIKVSENHSIRCFFPDKARCSNDK